MQSEDFDAAGLAGRSGARGGRAAGTFRGAPSRTLPLAAAVTGSFALAVPVSAAAMVRAEGGGSGFTSALDSFGAAAAAGPRANGGEGEVGQNVRKPTPAMSAVRESALSSRALRERRRPGDFEGVEGVFSVAPSVESTASGAVPNPSELGIATDSDCSVSIRARTFRSLV
jgi:hypothetical protein